MFSQSASSGSSGSGTCLGCLSKEYQPRVGYKLTSRMQTGSFEMRATVEQSEGLFSFDEFSSLFIPVSIKDPLFASKAPSDLRLC